MSSMGVTVGAANVRIMPNTKNFAASLKKFLERMERTNRLNVGLGLDSAGFAGEVRRAVSSAQSAAGKIDVKADLDPARLTGDARRAVATAQAAAGDIDVKMKVDRNAFASMLGGVVGSLGGVIGGIGKLSAIAGAATVVVGGLTPVIASIGAAAWGALAPMTALAAAMAPGAIVAAGLAVGVLKTAFAGMGDALKADSFEDFQAAIADMPPAAQAGATALRGLKEGFSQLGSEIKTGFWSQLSNLGDLSALIEPVRRTMVALSKDMGVASSQLVNFVSSGVGLEAVNTLLSNSSEAAGQLTFAFKDTLKGVIAVGAAASPIFAGIATSLAGMAEGWSARMIDGFRDGSLQAYFEGAVVKAQQLWAVMSQLGTIVGGVFSAMSAAGTPLLGMLGQAIEATARWVESAQGMSMLTGFFAAMSGAVQVLLPILGQIAEIILGTVAPALAGFIEAIGPGLSAVVEGIGAALGAIAPLMAPLGEALSGIMQALGPMIPVIAAVVLGFMGFMQVMPIIQMVGAAISMLASPIGLAVAAIALLVGGMATVPGVGGALMGMFSSLAGVVGGVLMSAMQALQPVFQTLGEAVIQMAPMFSMLAETIGGVLSSAIQIVAPILGALAQVIVMILPYVMQLAQMIGDFLAQAFAMIAPLIQPLVSAFMLLVSAIMPLFPALLQIVGILMGAIMPVIQAVLPIIMNLVTTIIGALVPVINMLVPIIIMLATAFANIIAAVMPVIQIIIQVAAVFLQLLAAILGFVLQAVAAIVGFVASVIAGFLNLSAMVIGIITTFVATILSAILTFVSEFIDFFVQMWATVSGVFSEGVNDAVTWVSGLAGRAINALSGAGSDLVESGRALIQGFIDGMLSKIKAVAGAARNIVKSARDFFPFSPAKRGPFSGKGWVLYSGRSIGETFAEGIGQRAGLAAAASRDLMGATADNLHGYKAGAGQSQMRLGASGADFSINIGTVVAADEDKPLREVERMQRMALVRGGRL